MFQLPRLLPWMATLDNIALGLKAQGMVRAQRYRLRREVALSLPDASLAQYPAELSGGMQSRAALARALVLVLQLWLQAAHCPAPRTGYGCGTRITIKLVVIALPISVDSYCFYMNGSRNP